MENLVGYARRNYLVPLPEGTDLEAINAELRQNCLSDQQRVMARRTDPIVSRLECERAFLGPLPTHAPELGPILRSAGAFNGTGAFPDQRLFRADPVRLSACHAQSEPLPGARLCGRGARG